MFPVVVQVVPFKDYTVYVYFEDGKVICYDAKGLLEKKAFASLNNLEFFMGRCTILNDTLAWDLNGDRNPSECVDIDPDTLYQLPQVKNELLLAQ